MDLELERIARSRSGLWLSSLFVFVVLLIFAVLLPALAPDSPVIPRGLPLTIAGILLSVVPALLWLSVFYLFDRREPEPKQNVFGVFVLGSLLALAVGQPVVHSLFRVQDWMYENWLVQLLASVLIIGFVQEFLKYAAVRYSIYSSPEFDERVDGVIYATAAGLGFATVLNFTYVLEHGGVDIVVGNATVIVNALAHASFAGITGYFLGQARFERTPRWWLPLGLSLASAANGVFFFFEDQATLRGLNFSPSNGVILAAVLAFIVFSLVYLLIRHANAETQALAQKKRAAAPAGLATSPAVADDDTQALAPPTQRAQRIAGLLAVITLAAALLAGLGLKTSVQGNRQVFDDGLISFRHPANWAVTEDLDGNVLIRSPYPAAQLFTDQLLVHHAPLPAGDPDAEPSLGDAAANWTLGLAQTLDAFRNLAVSDGLQVAGQDAIRIDYAYVTDPAAELGGAPGVPVVVRASDYLFISGDQLTVLSAQANLDRWEAAERQFSRIIARAARPVSDRSKEGGP